MAGRERETLHPDAPRRRALKVAVSALCAEAGFGHAQNCALETLAEMIQSYISEVGRSAQAYTELSCRTTPMCSDVSMALINMGCNIQKLPVYAQRRNKISLPNLGHSANPSTPRILHMGESKQHPSHIPDHLPPFPDPHTYIHTMTHKRPVTEYRVIREKAAAQKRDVERALTRFVAKTSDTEKLFEDDPYAFPLIACKPSETPYLDALLPKDEDFESLELEENLANQQKRQQEEADKQSKDGEPGKKEGEGTKEKSPSKEESSGVNQTEAEGDGDIDNPYLRPIKMPRLKGSKSSKSKW